MSLTTRRTITGVIPSVVAIVAVSRVDGVLPAMVMFLLVWFVVRMLLVAVGVIPVDE